MDSQATIPGAVRPALTRDRIVAAAAELLDEAGPDALTMRAVAQRLHAGVMSLYRHVSGREELLDLVLGAMTAEVPRSPLTGDWRADLATIGRDMRAALLRRPNLTLLLASRAGRGGSDLPLLDRTLGVMRAAGFGRRGAVQAAQALADYVVGAALREAASPGSSTGGERATNRPSIAEAAAQQTPERFANLAWAESRLGTGTADERFELGLELLLDGCAVYLARRKR
jgi:AcrR family transcriptional regulator